MNNGEQTQPAQAQAELVQKAKEVQQTKTTSNAHTLIVLAIVGCATGLRVAHDLDVQTVSTVYGAALGYATGIAIKTGAG